MADLSDVLWWGNFPDETEFAQQGAPTVAELLKLLRSEEELSRQDRNFLADLFDDNADTICKVKIQSRKKGRRKYTTKNIPQDAGHCIEELLVLEGKVELAVKAAAKKFKVSKSTMYKFWNEWNAAREVQEEIDRNERSKATPNK